MACFLVPAAEALVVTAAARLVKKSEKRTEVERVSVGGSLNMEEAEQTASFPKSKKLTLLSYFMWGGSLLLAFEHLWHGEVVPWFPFLTAASDADAAAEMLHEMSTVGVAMSALVTGVWAAVVGVAEVKLKQLKAQTHTS